jgi:pyrroline-5-carboxylate reductase
MQRLSPEIHIGFIGGGAMASAMINGLLNTQATDSDKLWSSDINPDKLLDHANKGVHTTNDNLLLIQACQVIILSVKPHIVPAVLKQIQPYFTEKHLIISIAAGVTINTIESDLLPLKARVVRVMPNTPALVGASATGYCLGSNTTKDDSKIVQIIFGSMGKSVELQEKDLDAVTGLSGSGPAYVFMFIEALADGGVRAGLTRDVAMQLAAQTVFGSAKMVLQTGKHPGLLKDQVASPGGTTIAGIHALENSNFRAAAMNAVVAASNRSTELGMKAQQQKSEQEANNHKLQAKL